MAVGERNALISVYDKDGIPEFASGLNTMGWNVLASGGTASTITEAGVLATNVSELIGREAILDHRVVTLSQEVHAGLLADPRVDMQIEELESLGLPFIDLVCVDLYPLQASIDRGDNEKEVTKNTDVGGPTMLHSAAKGRRIVVSNAEQRPLVISWLLDGQPDEEYVRLTLAAAAETTAEAHLKASAKYLGGRVLTRPIADVSPYARALRDVSRFLAA